MSSEDPLADYISPAVSRTKRKTQAQIVPENEDEDEVDDSVFFLPPKEEAVSYVVESVLDSKLVGRKVLYLVKWGFIMLATLACVIPAFTLPAATASASLSRASASLSRASVAVAGLAGHDLLPSQYRARWRTDDTLQPKENKETKGTNAPGRMATFAGAVIGVGLASQLGQFMSIAETNHAILLLNAAWAGSAYDISTSFLDPLTDWVASMNSLIAPDKFFGTVAFTAGVAIDVAAFTSMVLLLVMQIEEKDALATDERESELCLNHASAGASEPICGSASFDSTDGFACVETWVDGRLAWVCA